MATLSPEPPQGIHPLLWLVIFLLVGPPALFSKAAGKIPGFLGSISRGRQRRLVSTASSVAHSVSQSEIDRILVDYRRLRADYDELIEHNKEQDERMDRLELDLTEEKRIRWAAVGYIRVLLDAIHKHTPEAQIPAPPELLRNIL